MMKYLHFLLLLVISFGIPAQTKEYYPSGELKAEGQESENQKEGTWNIFYPDGTPSAILQYRAGLLHGKQVYFDFTGDTLAIEYREQDILQDTAIYFKEGYLYRHGQYKDDLYAGQWIYYYPDGKVERIALYQDGLPHGIWKFFHPSGHRWQVVLFKEGLENGPVQFYNEQGELTYSGQFKNGERIGQWFRYKNRKKKKWKVYN